MHAIDSTILTALNSLAAALSTGTRTTQYALEQFLNYAEKLIPLLSSSTMPAKWLCTTIATPHTSLNPKLAPDMPGISF
jgi:carbon starvation protein CstA